MRIHRDAGLRAAYRLLFPPVAAQLGLGPLAALSLAVVAPVWGWMSTLSAMISRKGAGKLTLETITISHFVEKVRFCMDRAGIEYEEEASVGILGVFLKGRSVPRLRVGYPAGGISIGNSSSILRFLYGHYCGDPAMADRVRFLRPTPEALALEARLDRYGTDLQHVIYAAALAPEAKSGCLQAWGLKDPWVPAWQRVLLPCMYPILVRFMRGAFKPSGAPKHRASAEALLQDMEDLLKGGQKTLLGGEERTFVDYTFAALSAWVTVPGFGGRRHTPLVHMCSVDEYPAAMHALVRDWTERYPHVVAWVRAVYADERMPHMGEGGSAR